LLGFSGILHRFLGFDCNAKIPTFSQNICIGETAFSFKQQKIYFGINFNKVRIKCSVGSKNRVGNCCQPNTRLMRKQFELSDWLCCFFSGCSFQTVCNFLTLHSACITTKGPSQKPTKGFYRQAGVLT